MNNEYTELSICNLKFCGILIRYLTNYYLPKIRKIDRNFIIKAFE